MRRPAWQGSARVGTSRPTDHHQPGPRPKVQVAARRDAAKLQVGRMHFLCTRPRDSLSCGSRNCATAAAKAARPKDLGQQAQRIRLGSGAQRLLDSAESVRTVMTKAIIREIQLEKLLIRCLFSGSWRVIRKNLIWDGKKRFFFMGAWPERYPQKIPHCTKHPRNIGLNGSQTTDLSLTPSRCFCKFVLTVQSLSGSVGPLPPFPQLMIYMYDNNPILTFSG